MLPGSLSTKKIYQSCKEVDDILMVMLWHNIAVIYLEIGETHCFPISRNFLRRAWSWEKQCFSCFLTLFEKGPGNERNEK